MISPKVKVKVKTFLIDPNQEHDLTLRENENIFLRFYFPVTSKQNKIKTFYILYA